VISLFFPHEKEKMKDNEKGKEERKKEENNARKR